MADINFSPSKLEVDFDKNITELYQAITDQDWETAIAFCRNDPVQAATWVVRHYEDEEDGEEREIMWRFLPLHSACARQPPVGLVQALIKAYPDGPKCVDDQGMYALHYACGNQASREVIRLLLSNNSDAAKIPDPRGMLPIHYLACWGPSSISVIDMLLVAYRDVADMRDDEGKTALDLAMESDYQDHEAVVGALEKWFKPSSSNASVISRVSANTYDAEEKKDEESMVSPRRVVANQAASTASQGSLRPFISPDELKRLQEEIRAMKSMMKNKDREWERKWELKEKDLTAQHKKILKENAEKLKQTEEELEKTKKLLENSNSDLKGLRLTLGDMMEKHAGYQKRSGYMNDRLGSLSASLQSMMEQQSTLTKAMKERNAKRRQNFEERAKRLNELIEIEKTMEGDEVALDLALKKQSREMEAIAAVVKAARDD